MRGWVLEGIDRMSNVMWTHPLGSRQIRLEVSVTSDEALRLIRDDLGAMFQLSDISFDGVSKGVVTLTPSRGCVEFTIQTEEQCDQRFC